MTELTMRASRAAYLREVLASYRATPTTLGSVRRADRELAGKLHDDGVPLYLVCDALLVAAARRVLNNAFSAYLPPIRSLAYILPVLTELKHRPLGPRDLADLRHRLHDALHQRY